MFHQALLVVHSVTNHHMRLRHYNWDGIDETLILFNVQSNCIHPTHAICSHFVHLVSVLFPKSEVEVNMCGAIDASATKCSGFSDLHQGILMHVLFETSLLHCSGGKLA